MKKVIYLILVLSLGACSDAEMRHKIVYWEMETKTLELEYLQKLYKLKEEVEYREQMRVIDSLFNTRKNY